MHKWKVELSREADKSQKKLTKNIRIILLQLVQDLEEIGPMQPSWPNFSKLERGKAIPDQAYHCHLKKGRPTYVACWRVISKIERIIEVYYAGSHEKAPY